MKAGAEMSVITNDDNADDLLLMSIECLQQQYRISPQPCLALRISRQYRLLAERNGNPQRDELLTNAAIWLDYSG